MTELERCDEEIQEHEANLCTGHKDVTGLFRALLDWRTERRLLIESGEKNSENGSAWNDGED